MAADSFFENRHALLEFADGQKFSTGVGRVRLIDNVVSLLDSSIRRKNTKHPGLFYTRVDSSVATVSSGGVVSL